MIDLDDVTSYASVDRSDAVGAVEGAADQWAEAVRRVRMAENLPTRHGITSVVFCGMGGSGIAGDVLQAIASTVGSIPVTVVKGYDLPAYVGPNTLVFCASYSGNTEETLSCFDQAHERKARIVTMATGGALAERAAQFGLSCIPPVEGLQPRAALPSLVVPTIVVAERLGLLPDMMDDLAETEGVLAGRAKSLARDVATKDNDAKRLARELDGMLPVIWGQDGLLGVVAQRWRAQLNENAKVPAFSSALPELDHNEIVGYDPGLDVLQRVALVVLRAPEEHGRIMRRIDVTLELVRPKVGAVLEAHAIGVSPLARLMSAALLGDFTSVYLALVRGVDPSPVEVIQALKQRIA